MRTISREYHFSAAHRIEGHPKCGKLHGHNYKVIVNLSGELDDHGMILDYADLDRVVKPIINQCDHRYLVSQSNEEANDPYATMAFARNEAFALGTQTTTAEELAEFFFYAIATQVEGVWSVEVQETEKSSAEFWPDDDDEDSED
jgi:6-pyruvoyltetrahydropterin/6-carboxytetrahydropterin synthase